MTKTITVPINQIPISGDIVKSIRFEKGYGFVEITFENGKCVVVHVNK